MDYLAQQAMQQKQAAIGAIGSAIPYPTSTGFPATQPGSAVQSPTGLSTAAKDLQEVIAETCRLAENLRSSLGINVPREQEPSNQDATFAGAIRSFRYQLSTANGDLTDVLQHINS